jgi:hypothetical protein
VAGRVKIQGQMIRSTMVPSRDLVAFAESRREDKRITQQLTEEIAFVDLGQKIDQMMHAAVGLLRAGLKQIVKFFVVSEESAG